MKITDPSPSFTDRPFGCPMDDHAPLSNVLRFSDYEPKHAASGRRASSALIIVLPTIRVERF